MIMYVNKMTLLTEKLSKSNWGVFISFLHAFFIYNLREKGRDFNARCIFSREFAILVLSLQIRFMRCLIQVNN